MNDQEIADRLDGMGIDGVIIKKCDACNDLWLSMFNCDEDEDEGVSVFSPQQLLAFCRAVVERVDKVENPCAICHKERGDNLAICTPCKERMTKMRNDPKYRELR